MHDKKLVNSLNAAIVSAYKVMGFLILAIILGGLLAYLGTHGFFLLNRSWVAPTIISPSDERILTLNAQIAAQAAAREKLLAERLELRARLDDALRVVAAEEAFQEGFAAALKGDRSFRARELGKLLALRRQQEETRTNFDQISKPFASMVLGRADALAGVNLIDREALLTTHHQVAQLGHSSFLLAEKEVELETKIAALRRDIAAIDALEDGAGGKMGASVDVLKLQQTRTESELDLARARELANALEENLRTIDVSIARYDALLAAIRSSPYLKAMEGNLTVAFVPYDNIAKVKPGVSLHACKLGLIWCSNVGSVARILDGEVTRKHPIRNVLLRGAMVEIELEDPVWAQKDLLHLGRAPFFL